MLSIDPLFLYLLIALNILVYVVLAIGIVRNRRDRLPKNPTVEDAFKYLELSLGRAFPDLPPGFTWKEAISKLKMLNLELDWVEIENTFKKYEDYRYGGIQYKDANVVAIMRLASRLPRGEEIARVS
jgi:hypothetical protein